MRVLLLSTAFSGMAQRVLSELKLLGHEVEQHYDLDPDALISQVRRFRPKVIVCPFLTQRIPDTVWQTAPCLIVHPGIEGDRGPSSLDWAISEGVEEWGVTLLQADAQYDSGDIWGTRRFPMRKASKSSIYKREVTQATIELIKQALEDVENPSFVPRHLDYTSAAVTGCERPLMRQKDREIDWANISSLDAARRLNAADSRPGVTGHINGYNVNMYGAALEQKLQGRPGDILATHDGAFCCATKDGAVWVKQLKCKSKSGLAPIKLPATMVLEKICDPKQLGMLTHPRDTKAIQEISVDVDGTIAYVHFNFYNGAMNTLQCMRLKNTLVSLKVPEIRTIVLMGGEDFFSNGIHLNCIEASDDPAQESWRNINAIDDLVMEIMDSPEHITVAAIRSNAGAGGVILALACDEVIVREGVVLNPHYKSMGLYGSEYWTYLLPKRVGQEKALEITEGCQPMGAQEAVELGLADIVFDEDWHSFHEHLLNFCRQLPETINLEEYLHDKVQRFKRDNASKAFADYRADELSRMKKTFFDPGSEYHEKRRAFVYKVKAKPQDELRLEAVSQKA